MKTIFLLLFIVTIISCKSDTTKNDKQNQALLADIKITDDTDIYGSWSMCSTSGNGSMTQYNVCPTVSFNHNGTGTVGNVSAILENFNWTLNKGVLTILFGRQSLQRTFPDTTYIAFIGKKNNNFNLTIRQQKLGYDYYLSR